MFLCVCLSVCVQSAVSQLSASTRQSIASASVAGSGRRRSVKDLLDIKAEVRRKALVQVRCHTYIHSYPYSTYSPSSSCAVLFF